MMSEIEKAIKHFKRVIAGLKYLDKTSVSDDSPYLKDYIKSRNIRNRRRLRASRIAVEALEKQTERVKGCDYQELRYERLLSKMIFVCSPYRGNEKKNIEFAKQCCKKVCASNQIPFAPHLYFTQFLDDGIEEERKQGIKYGLEFMKICNEVWVFGNTISSGMKEEIEYARQQGKEVKFIGS